ncbi:hypothetical protein C5167_029020 [Papaver somniferum]|uniref:zinc finger CCCH domain-containing protein 62-like n=1 Tax=Papaver somniferum TaxID=3469 RepID=UPI000E705D8E|nr:zinc finger CCCH domain-containing protein 62-like [Papaver somniferum]RZC89950.1 hypothetical protein C5167_029020 [Papaver somniferum]
MEKINQKLPLSDEEYDDEEGVEEGESSGSEEIAADDDSEEDPTFDVLEETRSSLSRLSLKKTKSRISKVIESGNDEEEEPDDVEIKVPELNAKDAKSYETIEKIIAGGQVEKLKVEQCKVYLRKNGLRLTGKKDVLIDRIKEHLGIINGGGELKYPASSFVYNCKGDACTGDVVMFEQNVYEMYNIASRSATGPPCGTRTVVGRIVKESYGSAKQQHTFTIEVLWSKGVKLLPPLHPLLIKGRNLYKLKTMRQLWADEEMRRKVLLEKHSRGSLARSNRETRIQQKEMRKKSTGQRVLRNERNNVQETERRMSTDELETKPAAQLQNEHPTIYTKQPTQTGLHKPAFPLKMVLSEVCMNTTMPSSITEQHHNNGYQVAKHRQNHISEKVKQSQFASRTQQKFSGNVHDAYANNAQNNFPEFFYQSHHANANQSSFNAPPRNSILGRAPSQRQLCQYYPQGRCRYGKNCKYLHEDRDKHVNGVTAKPSYPNENASSFNAPPRSPTRRSCNSSLQSPTRRSYHSPVQSPIRRSFNAPAQNSFNCPPRIPTHRSFNSPVWSPIARSFNALSRGSLNCPPWSPSRGRQLHAQNSFNYPPRSPNHRSFNSPARSPTPPRSPDYRSFNSPVRSPTRRSLNSPSRGSFNCPPWSPNRGGPPTQRQVCRYYTQGRCYHGENCKYLHERR